MKPLHYLVHLEPNLTEFTFDGFTTIKINFEEKSSEIVLNAKELTIHNCKMGTEPDIKECKFELKEDIEELHVHLPTPIQGKHELRIEFQGTLNDNLYGFYRSKYEVDGVEKYMATTQFEERDARAAFPCFDHPSLKAKFDIEFVIEANLQSISNTAIKQENPLPNGKKLVQFETTPPMSTYLLYFGVAEFEFIEDASKEPKIRVAAPPGKIQFGNFALDMGRKSIDYGEQFTGVKYPLSKCDHIAVSDFAAGAMENFGAITYRENALLVHPGKTPKPMLVRVGSVIAHETAHMWFGDMVSPADWKYLWLNESFAEYFTSAIVDAFYPEWNIWDNFIQQSFNAMQRDSLKYTVPIELPGEDTDVSIDPSSAPIIYEKGAAIIRVLKGYLGKEKFKTGIKGFLNKFMFDVATSNDYWQAFEEATGEPIKNFADSWVHQKGYPMLSVKQEENQLKIKQTRFTFLENDDPTIWFIPISILFLKSDGSQEIQKFVLKEANMSIDLPPSTEYFKLNADQTGYYRVSYEETTLEQLGELMKSKKLNHIDRFGIISDLGALTQKGLYPLDFYLDFIQKYCDTEDEYLPVSEITTFLHTFFRLNEKYREKISQVGKKICAFALEKIGFDPKEEDTVQIAQLRDSLIWLGYRFNYEPAKEFGIKQFQDFKAGNMVHPDIFASIMKIGTASGVASLDFIKSKIEDPQIPENFRISLIQALGHFQNDKTLHDVLKYCLEKIPKRNRIYPFIVMRNNFNAQKWLWDYYKENIDLLLNEFPEQLFQYTISMMVPDIGAFFLDDAHTFLEKLTKQKPKMKNTITMAHEMLDIKAKIIQLN